MTIMIEKVVQEYKRAVIVTFSHIHNHLHDHHHQNQNQDHPYHKKHYDNHDWEGGAGVRASGYIQVERIL